MEGSLSLSETAMVGTIQSSLFWKVTLVEVDSMLSMRKSKVVGIQSSPKVKQMRQ